ncbi:MAG: M20/M25/M40 family metallo-hydrolase [Gemmatimonadaceae bacterium]
MPNDASLRSLWRRPAVAAARAALAARHDEIVRTQIVISEIPAPTGEEATRAGWIEARFRALGLAGVRRDAAGNVIARRPGAAGGPAVVVCAHLDTVFPRDVAVRVRRAGGRLVGPGIGDNGRGLAAMLALAEAIGGPGLRTRIPVDFVATTGEEGSGDLCGAKHLFADSAREARAAVILDGAGDERIVCRALGSRRYRISYRGVGGHSWTAFGTPNAVHAAAIAAARLAALPLPQHPRTTLTVGRMGGGISINAIPEDGWIEVDLRSSSAQMIARFDHEVRAAAHAAELEENARGALGAPPLTVDVRVIGERPGGETPPEHALVTAAAAATRFVGREPELATASTDANVPISLGIPAIAIGAGGRGGDAHSVAEWFEDADGARGVERALAVVLAAAGVAD